MGVENTVCLKNCLFYCLFVGQESKIFQASICNMR